MKTLLAASIALMVSAAVPAQDAVPKALAPFQGTWVIATVNEQPPAAGEPEASFTVTGAAYTVTVNQNVVERGTIKIDPAKKPWTIDFLITFGESANKTQLGILEASGDSVRVCVNAPGATERPADFSLRPGFDVVVAKKKKP